MIFWAFICPLLQKIKQIVPCYTFKSKNIAWQHHNASPCLRASILRKGRPLLLISLIQKVYKNVGFDSKEVLGATENVLHVPCYIVTWMLFFPLTKMFMDENYKKRVEKPLFSCILITTLFYYIHWLHESLEMGDQVHGWVWQNM